MKKFFLFGLFLFFGVAVASDSQGKSRIPLFQTLFHDFGRNALGSFTYGFGLPWALAAGGTYGLVESGVDWEWNRFCVRHETASTVATIPGASVGTFAPVAVPLILYFASDDSEMQLTGVALGQAAILGFGVSSFVKVFTGRTPPHVADAADGDPDYQEDYSGKFKWGILRGGVFDGWPSGHTTTAVAMATTLATLYPESVGIRLGAVAYSVIIGVSMSFMAHWTSDIWGGALAGFAIGRTVGKSFARYRDGKAPDAVSFYAFPGGAGICVKF